MYLQSHGDVSDMPFQVGGVTVPGNSSTRGAVPATDIAAAIDDLTQLMGESLHYVLSA